MQVDNSLPWAPNEICKCRSSYLEKNQNERAKKAHIGISSLDLLLHIR